MKHTGNYSKGKVSTSVQEMPAFPHCLKAILQRSPRETEVGIASPRNVLQDPTCSQQMIFRRIKMQEANGKPAALRVLVARFQTWQGAEH